MANFEQHEHGHQRRLLRGREEKGGPQDSRLGQGSSRDKASLSHPRKNTDNRANRDGRR